MSLRDARTAATIIMALSAAACATTAPRHPTAPAAFADADSTASTAVAPGVTHTFVHDDRGPWAIHVLEIDTLRCRPVLEARAPGSVLGARATTSSLSSDALAGINADFFMLPGGTPVGAQVTRGVPLIGPTDRPVFALTHDGWRIGVASIRGHARENGDSADVAQLNRPAAAFSAYRGTTSGLTLFTSWTGDSVPADSTARRVTLRIIEGDEASGRAVVTSSDSAAAGALMQPGTAVLLAHGSARQWARRRSADDTVSWKVDIIVDAPAIEVVGGFPELLRDGREVLAEQTVGRSFASTRHPRTAIGWTTDGRLLFVAVDGRQAHSDGMSLHELTWLFRRLGAAHALNLDGGGSTAMVVNGAVVNSPSDRQGERAVGNALALAGCR